MTRLFHLPRVLSESLQQNRLFKVIAGLSNFDEASVARISHAAGVGGADLLDVACQPDLVRIAAELSGLPICVSSVEPELFPACVAAGAVMIEIGNFDTFYPQGRVFKANEVLDLTRESRKLLPDVALSVTVPHVLPLDEQARLAIELIKSGADLIQTEGGTMAKPLSSGTLGLIEKASPTLAAVHSISKALRSELLDNPILCASGLSEVTVPMAIAIGASGVGIGSAINRLDDELAMIAEICRIKQSLQPLRLPTIK